MMNANLVDVGGAVKSAGAPSMADIQKRPDTSTQARASRSEAMASAYGSHRIEGLEPSDFGRTVHQDWVDRRITSDEAVAILNKHYKEYVSA
jgi:hypothetical protein